MGLIGLLVGGGASGAIALAAPTYPTAIRSTGIGWAMGMGRRGQVVSPLVAGFMMASGLASGQIMPIIGTASLLAAGFVVLLGLVARRSGTASLGTAMPGSLPHGRAPFPRTPRKAGADDLPLWTCQPSWGSIQ